LEAKLEEKDRQLNAYKAMLFGSRSEKARIVNGHLACGQDLHQIEGSTGGHAKHFRRLGASVVFSVFESDVDKISTHHISKVSHIHQARTSVPVVKPI